MYSGFLPVLLFYLTNTRVHYYLRQGRHVLRGISRFFCSSVCLLAT